MNSKEWTTVITAAVALYGAALSTLNFLVARRERQRNIRVTLKEGLTPHPFLSDAGIMLFVLKCVNAGRRPVTITGEAILFPTREQLFLIQRLHIDKPFPCELTEGTSCTVCFEAWKAAEYFRERDFSGSIELVAEFTDAVGNKYRSKAAKFNVDAIYKQAETFSVL